MDKRTKDQLKISRALDAFKKAHHIENLSPMSDEAGDTLDAQFSMSGCDVCNSGGADVYECDGYSKKYGVLNGFEVCHECLCVEANGPDLPHGFVNPKPVKVIFKSVKDFGRFAVQGVHQVLEGERDIENALYNVDRDGFHTVVFYVSYHSGWMTDTDFRGLISDARDAVKTYNEAMGA